MRVGGTKIRWGPRATGGVVCRGSERRSEAAISREGLGVVAGESV